MGPAPGEPHAYLVVRAIVSDAALRDGFDHWYSTNHAPLAVTLLGAQSAWRFWSITEPSVHYAVYRFENEASLRSGMESDAVARLLGEFDSAWPASVTRTRELIVQVDTIHK